VGAGEREHEIQMIDTQRHLVGRILQGLGDALAEKLPHRFLAGDSGDACVLAREAQANIIQPRFFQLDTPLAIAVILAAGSETGLDALHAKLRDYHDAALTRDWGPRATHNVVLYGGILAAMRQQWDLASQLLAAGTREGHGSQTQAHLHAYFRTRVRAALGAERFNRLRDAGRTMPLSAAVAAAVQ
jgi:hypothetical protein